MERRDYAVSVRINGYQLRNVVIDPHYELKHAGSMDDQLILRLIELLDGGDFTPEAKIHGFEYYVADNLFLGMKRYRLVWLIDTQQLYLGVINAFRRK